MNKDELSLPMNRRLSLLLKTLAIIISVETAIMFLLHGIVRVPEGWAGNILDGVLLGALTGPIFYLWLFREIGEKESWRQAHAQLEDRFRLLVESAPEAIYVQIGGRFSYLNPAAVRLLGAVDEASLVGRDLLERVHPDLRAAVRERMRLVTEERRAVPVMEGRCLRLDGTPVDIECSAVPIDQEGKTGALVFLRDISQRKKAETALRENEERYRSVVDNIGIGVFLVDPSMRVLSLNQKMREWFPGADAEQRLLCHRAFNSPAREEVCRDCPTQKTLQDGQVHEAVREAATSRGAADFRVISSPIKDSAGKVVAAVEMVEDITARRRDEDMLRRNYEMQRALNEMLRASLSALPLPRKLDKILDLLLSAPWFMIERKGCIFLQDGPVLAMAAQIGLSEPVRAACGRLPSDYCLCGRVARTGEEILSTQLDERHENSYEGMSPHGHLCLPLKADVAILGVLNLYLVAGEAPDEQQKEFARAAADIIAGTVLLAKAEEKFLQSQKMEAVGRLAGGVAHDFNNILTAIKGYSEFLIAAFTAEDPRRADAQEIFKSADRAAALTRQLLAFSRRQVLSPRVLDLNEIVSGMAKMLKRLLGDDTQLVTHLSPDLAAAIVDAGQMEQVIMNLVVNARDAMPKGGIVTVETANVCRRPESGKAHAEGPACAYVMLSVSDTGTGMAPEVLGHVFEPFFTTKPKGKGTGLGLSTVYGIIKQSGGDIEISSEPGRGTILRIFLPASRQAAEAAGAAASAVAPSPSGTETVLLVEDEDSVRSLAERTLSDAGYRVLSAADAPQALAHLRALREPLDLLLSDVIMPGKSGPELAEEILGAHPGVKVLFISGNEDGALTKHGVLRPGVSLLPKPFSPNVLAHRVREVLDGGAPRKSA